MTILQAYQTKNRCYIKAQPATPRGIVVHSTAVHNRWLHRFVDSPEALGVNTIGNTNNRPEATTCVHAFIGWDKDKKVIVAQTLPYEYACWGCGAPKGQPKSVSYNYDPQARIQFEICQGPDADEGYYWQAILVAGEYCAYLCKRFGWGTDAICSHQEAHKAGHASNHNDADAWMRLYGDDMNRFRARVAEMIGKESEAEPMAYTKIGTATIQTAKPAGLFLWADVGKSGKVIAAPQGVTVDVYNDRRIAPDGTVFVWCGYGGLQGWADSKYLSPTVYTATPTPAVDAAALWTNAQDALTALQAALNALKTAYKK